MHSPVILLTKAENRNEAQSNVEIFMDQYHLKVWDWYSIGNRWHNALAPKNKREEFTKWVREEYSDVFTDGMYSINDLENKEDRGKIQAKWEELGLRGKNTFYSSYGFDVSDTEEDYNIIPLSECVETVKDWCRDLEKSAEENFQKLLKTREKEKENREMYKMSAYHAQKYSNDVRDYFNFDSCVYNIDTYEGETIPEEVDKYWAVMIDMHN